MLKVKKWWQCEKAREGNDNSEARGGSVGALTEHVQWYYLMLLTRLLASIISKPMSKSLPKRCNPNLNKDITFSEKKATGFNCRFKS